jgi:uncharacterized protein (DUF1800 family)
MFGARRQDLVYFQSRSLNQAVDELLGPTAPLPAPPVKNYVNNNVAVGDPDLLLSIGQTWVNNFTLDSDADSRRRDALRTWWMGVLLNQDRSIREKMNLFWHNHFATETEVVANACFLYKHHDYLRRNALGNFRQMVKDITIDPAMLAYLNGDQNSKTAPDENYARELQELFTLGKENDPNYLEEDVKTAARVLTGWRTDRATNKSFFDIARHDTGNKTFSSFYNNATITGKTGPDAGLLELEDLITMIFAKKTEVSRYIIKKIYRWFVYYEITPQLEQEIIDPLAQLLVSSNWEIKPVLKALLTSEHFFAVENRGCMIKSPVDFVVGLCREFNVDIPDGNDVVIRYNQWNNFRRFAANMLQSIGQPPDVAGWKAYYQKPFYYEMWINSDTYPKRIKFTDEMAAFGYVYSGYRAQIDPVAFAKSMPNPGDPNALVKDAVEALFQTGLSDSAREVIKKEALLSGQDSDYYWTEIWSAYIAAPGNAMARDTVKNRLVALLKYLMNLAEYQLI